MSLTTTRARILVKHPSLILKLPYGEAVVSKAHMDLELRKARRLYDDKNSARESIICHRNAYLYFLCREVKPLVVVETGVRRGESTAFILQALHDNDEGELHSIDLPDVDETDGSHSKLPDFASTGFLVPPTLTHRWNLIKGDSKVELRPLLESLGRIGIFHHDSLHTYEHMTYEFEEAWSHLSYGGYLVSDDVNCNDAFFDFCGRVGRTPWVSGDHGLITKEESGG